MWIDASKCRVKRGYQLTNKGLKMKTDYQTYATGLGKAAYEISTDKGRFFVHASNRAQAARILERDGFIIRDISRVA